MQRVTETQTLGNLTACNSARIQARIERGALADRYLSFPLLKSARKTGAPKANGVLKCFLRTDFVESPYSNRLSSCGMMTVAWRVRFSGISTTLNAVRAVHG